MLKDVITILAGVEFIILILMLSAILKMLIYYFRIPPAYPFPKWLILKPHERALVHETETENDTDGHQRRPSRKWVAG